MCCREQQRLQPEVTCVAVQTDAEKLPSPEPTPAPPQQQSPVDSSGEDTETEDISEDGSDVPRVRLCQDVRKLVVVLDTSSAATRLTVCQTVVQHVIAGGMRDARSLRMSCMHAAPWTVGRSQQGRN